MPYVMKVRGAPVVIVRRYACDDCEQEFEFSHHGRDEAPPDCPYCKAAEARNIPASFAINSNKAKAVDMAYQIAEEDYGMTNMRDNSREGDQAFVGPSPIQTSEREAIVQQMKDAAGPDALPEHLVPQVNEFWKNSGQAQPMPPHIEQLHQQKVAEARMMAGAARADGSDPIELLHKAKPQTKYQVLSRATGKESA